MIVDCVVPICLGLLDEPAVIRCENCAASELVSIATACHKGWDEIREDEREKSRLPVYWGICPSCERERWRPAALP